MSKGKRQHEVLDFKIDMAEELAGRLADGTNDTLTTITWSVETPGAQSTPLVISSSSHDDSSATVWLSGGTRGFSYTVVALMHTVGGRTYEPTFPLSIY